MGVAIENANGMSKAYSDNQESLTKAMINQSMRISKIENMQYKLSYLMSSSFTGKNLYEKTPGDGDWQQDPLDTQVTLNLQL